MRLGVVTFHRSILFHRKCDAICDVCIFQWNSPTLSPVYDSACAAWDYACLLRNLYWDAGPKRCDLSQIYLARSPPDPFRMLLTGLPHSSDGSNNRDAIVRTATAVIFSTNFLISRNFHSSKSLFYLCWSLNCNFVGAIFFFLILQNGFYGLILFHTFVMLKFL